ncbi:UvrD-helicase domain-containing protein [Micromonospora sp. NBC_01412]
MLVDEGQDLSPTHWQMLRALVVEGADDLFIAEDSHQRIYGNRTVLGRHDIKIVGRSQRLTLNYRTTAQDLRYALAVLDGGDFVDLEEQAEATGHRSARSGPIPAVENVESLVAEQPTSRTCRQTAHLILCGHAPGHRPEGRWRCWRHCSIGGVGELRDAARTGARAAVPHLGQPNSIHSRLRVVALTPAASPTRLSRSTAVRRPGTPRRGYRLVGYPECLGDSNV